jgi:branched-subunit amino acid aminotransferase/4-amino-4-deoxychorismate lyase
MDNAFAFLICGTLAAIVIVAGMIDDHRIRNRERDRVTEYFRKLQDKINDEQKRQT